MDLEPDETRLVHVVGEVGGGDPVDPRAVAVALHDDPVVVPAVVVEGILGLGLDLVEPLAPGALVVEPRGHALLLLGDLALGAVDDPGPLPILGVGIVLGVDVAADLNARVEGRVTLDLQFEREVLVVALAEEGVRAALDGRADDRTSLDLILGVAAVDLPAVEGLPVEERDPAFVLGSGGRAVPER